MFFIVSCRWVNNVVADISTLNVAVTSRTERVAPSPMKLDASGAPKMVDDSACAANVCVSGPMLSRPWYVPDRKSTRLNSSHVAISYAVFCLKKKKHQLVSQRAKTRKL